MFPGSLQYEFQVQFNRLDYMPPNYHAFIIQLNHLDKYDNFIIIKGQFVFSINQLSLKFKFL